MIYILCSKPCLIIQRRGYLLTWEKICIKLSNQISKRSGCRCLSTQQNVQDSYICLFLLGLLIHILFHTISSSLYNYPKSCDLLCHVEGNMKWYLFLPDSLLSHCVNTHSLFLPWLVQIHKLVCITFQSESPEDYSKCKHPISYVLLYCTDTFSKIQIFCWA